MKQLAENELPGKLVDALNELVRLLWIAGKKRDKHFDLKNYDERISPQQCLEWVSAEELEEVKRICDEQGGFLDRTDKQTYRYKARNSGDANFLDFKRWQKSKGLWNAGPVYAELKNLIDGPKQSGSFWYPNNGYMGWHTNENQMGGRLYCSYAAEEHKSFFRYQIPGTEEIVTSWDEKGWTFRYFEVGDTPETRFWHCVYSNTDRISIGIKSRFNNGVFEFHRLKGHHVMAGRWSLESLAHLEEPNYYMIRNKRLAPIIEKKEPVLVDFSEICHKGMDKEDPHELQRYDKCNPRFPGIIVEGMPNYKNRKYRMIDGKHRIRKLKNAGANQGLFYVLSFSEVQGLIEERKVKKSLVEA